MAAMTVPTLDLGTHVRPCAGEIVSGDAAVTLPCAAGVLVGIVDVLGHGPEAHAVAERIEVYLRDCASLDLLNLMNGLHRMLKGSLGAAIGLSHVEQATGRMRYVGVGNTRVRRIGTAETRLVSRDGIVGSHLPSLREENLVLQAGDLLLLTTDGVKESFGVQDYFGLLSDSAAIVARLVVHRFGKDHDDATCVAVRVCT
jgi:hypothetical protein